MSYKTMTNRFNCIVFGSTCIILSAMGLILLLYLKRPLSAVIFLALALIYGYLALSNGAVVQADKDGISRKCLGLTLCAYSWDQIAEVGVIGINVVRRGSSQKTGTLYVYFSPRPLTEDLRFDLGFSWPPKKDTPYFVYDPKTFSKIQYLWGKRIETYHTGDLNLNS